MPAKAVAVPAARTASKVTPPDARKGRPAGQGVAKGATPPKANAINKRKASAISTPQPLTRKFPTFGRRADGGLMSASSSVASASPSRVGSRTASPPPKPNDPVAPPSATLKAAPQTPSSKTQQQQAAATKVQALARQKHARNEAARRSQFKVQERTKRADLAATRVQAIARRKRAQKEVARLSLRRSGYGGGGIQEDEEPMPTAQPRGPVVQSASVAQNRVSSLQLAGVGDNKAAKGGRGAATSPPPSRPAAQKLITKGAAAKSRGTAPLKVRPGGSPAPARKASPARSRPQTPKAGRGRTPSPPRPQTPTGGASRPQTPKAAAAAAKAEAAAEKRAEADAKAAEAAAKKAAAAAAKEAAAREKAEEAKAKEAMKKVSKHGMVSIVSLVSRVCRLPMISTATWSVWFVWSI